MSALKRLEEKHPSIAKRDGSAGFFCKRCAEDHPCSELKLARALDALLLMHSGGPNSVSAWDDATASAERVLEEVAGE